MAADHTPKVQPFEVYRTDYLTGVTVGQGIILGDGSVLYRRFTDRQLLKYESISALQQSWGYNLSQIKYVDNGLATDLVNFLGADHQATIDNLNETVKDQRKILDNYRRQHFEDQHRLSESETELEKVRGKHQRATKKVAELVNFLDGTNHTIDTWRQELRSARAECREIEESAKRRVVEWQGYYNSAMRCVDEEHQRRTAAEKKVEELQTRVDEADATIPLQAQEIAYLKSVLEMCKRMPAREVLTWYRPFDGMSAFARKNAAIAAHYAGLTITDRDPYRNQQPVRWPDPDQQASVDDPTDEEPADLGMIYLILMVTLLLAEHAYMLFW